MPDLQNDLETGCLVVGTSVKSLEWSRIELNEECGLPQSSISLLLADVLSWSVYVYKSKIPPTAAIIPSMLSSPSTVIALIINTLHQSVLEIQMTVLFLCEKLMLITMWLDFEGSCQYHIDPLCALLFHGTLWKERHLQSHQLPFTLPLSKERPEIEESDTFP